ncbi:hypothetical protein [Acidianus manzaensis]|uniref:Uncharacterized protein n=1 Tax=Acidianus manzaensis TaxID=282676 RepID=A0A1W6K219_9CREN|nr:hypothetical protein [Acidianus manzaensis]ARM76549.1 hypothetical protein B6F84_11315 [Acidianus manzaensis]
MPRKKSDKKEEDNQKKTTNKKQKKEKYIDAEVLLNEYLDEMINGLNISFLKLKPEEYKELIKEPFVAAVGQVKSKPKSSTILNRLLANRDAMMEFLAMKLIRIIDIDNLTDDQFEFVVYNTKHGIVNLAPKLYKMALKKNRQDLIEILKYNWNIFGIVSPITCPRCGFNSIMPDLLCKVCDYEISMKELKTQINVIELLKELEEVNPSDFKEILTSGYFYYTPEGAVAPSKIKPSNGLPQLYFEVVLNKDEKKILSNIHSTQSQSK